MDGPAVLSRHLTDEEARGAAADLWKRHGVWAVVKQAAGTNPYMPESNPFSHAQTQYAPGTPDDLLDGPYDPTLNQRGPQPASERERQPAAAAPAPTTS
jgi:hypothetical protein